MRDDELIRRAQAGEPGAFQTLYFTYVDQVQRQAYFMLGPDAELEDVVQLTFLQVHRRLPTFRFDASFGTWLHRITLNTALEQLRKRRRWFRRRDDYERLHPEALHAVAQAPDASYDRGEARRILYGLLHRLDEKKRAVYVLYEIEGHTLEEIAALLATSRNTIAARLRSARQELQRGLEKLQRREAPTARLTIA